MLRVTFALAMWLVVFSTTSANQDQTAGGAASIRSIPGLTGPDTHPEACVSCHIEMKDIGLDARLSTALSDWEQRVPDKVLEIARDLTGSPDILTGKHPVLALPLEDVPSSCVDCPDVASTAPPFGPLIHLAHYQGGESNHFLSVFGGECSLCHKIDWDTGTWRIPDGTAD